MKRFLFGIIALTSSLSYGSAEFEEGAGAGAGAGTSTVSARTPEAEVSAGKFAWYSNAGAADKIEEKMPDTLRQSKRKDPYIDEKFKKLFRSSHPDFSLEGALYIRLSGGGLYSNRTVVAKPDSTAKELSEWLNNEGFFVRLIGSKDLFDGKQVENSDEKLTEVAIKSIDPKVPGEFLLYAVRRLVDQTDEGALAKIRALIEKDEAMIKALEAIASRK
jgi:hypothetical protein